MFSFSPSRFNEANSKQSNESEFVRSFLSPLCDEVQLFIQLMRSNHCDIVSNDRWWVYWYRKRETIVGDKIKASVICVSRRRSDIREWIRLERVSDRHSNRISRWSTELESPVTFLVGSIDGHSRHRSTSELDLDENEDDDEPIANWEGVLNELISLRSNDPSPLIS